MKVYWYFIISLFILASQGTVFSQNLYSPYPIIFVHGLNDDYKTWSKDGANNDLIDYLINAGFINGGNLNVTLDYLRSTTNLNNTKEEDVHLFPSNNIKGDFYTLNFCVHSSGSIPSDIPGFLIAKATVVTPIVLNSSTQFDVTIPVQFNIGDIIRIRDEFMEVTGIGSSYITVNRHIFGSVASNHYISDEIWNLSTESNQASIAKQGYGLKLVIDAVKVKTGAKKVILVGHSMGGLAIREYLRSYYNNDIAKVVTIGTPHLGSIATEIFALGDAITYWKGIDVRSDAVRDLSYNYSNVDGNPDPPYGDSPDNGVFLFGGDELGLESKTNFYSYDINANGVRDDNYINGLSTNLQSLPAGISYSWIVSQWLNSLLIDGDGCVRLQRQFPWVQKKNGKPLIEVGDTLMTHVLHTDETKDYSSLIRGLDEPDNISLAYEIGSSSITKGFITYQTNNNAIDKDIYKLNLSKPGFLTLNISGYFEAGVDSIELLDSNGNPLSKLKYPDFYNSISKFITAGTYYVRVSGTAKSNPYMNPYTITTNFYESESAIEGIVNLEYFLDSDPSWGKGIVLNISSSSNIVENINVPLNNVSDGFHTLFIRVKDIKNRWSIPQNIPFYRLKVTSLNISQLEYFLDTDPGLGNGNQLSVTASSDMTKNFNIPLSGIQNGFHVLYVRAKGKNGNWSICSNTAFYKTDISSTDIVKMEYYIDVDPGFGNAITVSVTKGIDISKKVNIDLSNVSEGFHTLYIRAKNASGKWSLNAINAFYCMQPQTTKITDFEYFFDMDPGFGYGTSIPVTPATSNITKLFNVDLACLSTGTHTFYVRAKNDLGNWSLIYSKNVAVSTVAPVITQNGTMLHSNATKGNQWYNQNGLINGATNQDYVVPSNGDYCVIVTHSGCSSDKSNIIKVFVSGIEQTSLNNSIKVYPNPVQNELIIEFDGSTSFEILNLMGQVIYNGNLIKTAIVQTSNFSTGVYLIKFKMGKTFEYKKFIKE